MNHLDLVGWINTARYKWAEIRGKEIKFRPATFYLGVVDMLARGVEDVRNEREGGEVQGALRDPVGESRVMESERQPAEGREIQGKGEGEGKTLAGQGAELKETND